jgi:hypothetical protein
MHWITIAVPPFNSIETFDAVRDRLGVEPEGLLARWVGTVDGGVRVVMVWRSRAHADHFFAHRLGPALAATLGPEPAGAPTVTAFEAQRTYRAEPAPAG